MSPLLRALRFEGASSGSSVGTALTRTRGVGVDLDWPDGGGSSFPFADLMKVTSTLQASQPSGVVIDADQWVSNIASNSSVIEFELWSSAAYTSQAWFPPGTYKIRMPVALTNAGWRVSWVLSSDLGGTVTNTGVGVTSTMVVPDLGTTGVYHSLNINIRAISPNSGPTTARLYGVQAYDIRDEALLDAGGDDSYWNPRWLADHQGWVKSIRAKDWVGTDNTVAGDTLYGRRRVPVVASELTKETDRTWGMWSWAGPIGVNDRGKKGNHVPYAVCAKLAKKLNAGLMLAVPLLDDGFFYQCSASTGQFSPCWFPDGAAVVMGNAPTPFVSGTTYYVRDSVQGVLNTGHFKLAATPGGTAIVLTETRQPLAGNPYDPYYDYMLRVYPEQQFLDLYDAIAQECYAAAPGIDVMPDAGNECWNSGGSGAYGFNTCRVALHGKVPGTLISDSPAIGYAWALMRTWEAFEAHYPRAQVIRLFQGQGVFFAGFSAYGYAYTDARLHVGQTVANLIDAHCSDFYCYTSMTGTLPPSDTYGFNDIPDGTTWFTGFTFHTNEVVHTADGKNWKALRNNTSVTPVEGADWTQWSVHPTNGLVGGGASWSDAQILEFAKLSVDTRKLLGISYKAAGDALRTNPTPAGYVIYEGGRLFGAQSFASGLTAWVTRLTTWELGSSLHGDFMTYYGAAVAAAGITTLHQYQYTGSWRNQNDNDAPHFGMKRAPQLPDNAGSTAYKALTW